MKLLSFNKDIYNLREPVWAQPIIPKTLKSSRTCKIPKKRLSSIYIVNQPYEIAICLPPKCGTTNWRKVKAFMQFSLGLIKYDSYHMTHCQSRDKL